MREAGSLQVIEDHADYASSYPQLSDDGYGSLDSNGDSSADAEQIEMLLEAEQKFTEALKLYEEAICLAPGNVSYKQAMDITSLKIEGNTLFGKGLEFVSMACDLQDEINTLPADHAAHTEVLEKYKLALVAYEQAQKYFNASSSAANG